MQVKGLSNVQMRAGAAAIALLLCMVLPWYRAALPRDKKLGGGVVHDNLTAFGAFSWVEAAVLCVSGAVLYLLYARSQDRGFHLPGGDGWAVTAAGGWTIFLLVWRFFDRPRVGQDVEVGLQWGLFVTLGVAVTLLLAGQAMRREHRPEPPNPAAEDPTWEQPTRKLPRAPVDSGAVTSVLREDRPAWEGEPPPPPGRAKPVVPKPPPDEGKLF
jgi:hypothetical protein